MAISGYLNHWIAFVYILVWVLIFLHQGLVPALGMLFQAPIYGWFIVVSMVHALEYGRFMLLWILVVLVATWPLFPQTIVPNFLDGLRDLWSTRSKTD